ncbi:protein of unknown function DUF152 [Gloeothece citriformis PCC 7424]|uniref:Purine nucleoside phosphorylase n=1 Tax=Gloeothece citriformis (strain PCC 7424) TaxID=65393 RepID=B7KE85_GLOC7|nr:peptidoglycan editing factor PgeF [Gloeothece citriformis]ACK73203.1 protein of unknown function DUF152 [Gloeothece citriformis PCC 7424]
MILSYIPETQTSTWQWQNWNGLSYLTCSLLQNWPHGFFSAQFYPRLPEDLVEVLDPNASVYRVRQVHDQRVLTPTEIETALLDQTLEEKYPPADGIITDHPQQSIWVASADCTPVLIADVKTGKTAAIHAGWRGTAKKIVPEAISRFLSFGSQLENLRVAMGPAIAGEVYQVSLEVALEVGSSVMDIDPSESTETRLERLHQIPFSPILEDQEPGRVRLDVRRVNYIQLQQLGISPDQIAIASYCTYQQPEHFFSYRRTKEKKVQWSGIVSL